MTSRKFSRGGFAALLLCSFVSLATAASPAPPAGAANYQLNDRVQTNVNGLGWITGTVVDIGKGDQEGKVQVHADGYPNKFWVRSTMTSAIRKVAGAAPATAAATSAANANLPPRLGKYLIMSYGASNPLHLGYIELRAGGNYKLLDMGGRVTGDGHYEYDVKDNQVRWINGPIFTNKWGGKFEVSREGKTHNIRLTRSTLGTNSTDGSR
jgi:hypothetical protein